MIVIVVMALISTVWLLLKVNYSKRIKNYKGRVIAKVIDVKEGERFTHIIQLTNIQ